MRITTNSILRNYGRNLNTSLNNLNSSRDKVMTKRNFNKISEDPSAAARAFKLRRDFSKNNDYLENVENIIKQYDSVENSAMQITKSLRDLNKDILTGITDSTSPEQRKLIATSLRESANSIILNANATFGDKFLFGGTGTNKVPFELTSDGKLTYRGTDVNSPSATDQALLKKYAEEDQLYVDIGFGLQETAPGVIKGDSAFDISTPGINLLGYGNNANGASQNVVTLLNQMADELESPSMDKDKFKTYTDEFTKCSDRVIDFETKLGTKSNFLESTKTRLEQNNDTLNEKIVALENVDLAASISDYTWAQYAYNAALKVGNSILSPSFIDFMK